MLRSQKCNLVCLTRNGTGFQLEAQEEDFWFSGGSLSAVICSHHFWLKKKMGGPVEVILQFNENAFEVIEKVFVLFSYAHVVAESNISLVLLLEA